MQRYKIRDLGKKYGLVDDDRYSYDPQTRAVRYDGRLLTIADDEVGGVSYKNNEKDFLADLHDWYRLGDDELVAVRDYVGTTGSKNGRTAPKVDFSKTDDTILVGGTTMRPSFISEDGRAYAPKSRVDEVLKKLTPEKPTYKSPYENRIVRKEDQLEDRSFSYNPEKDPVYQALKAQYTREGNRAMADTAGTMSSLTGGRLSSAAATAGAQARMAYAEKLTDSIPELAKNAYSRYADINATQERALERLYKQEDADYDQFQGRLDQFNREVEEMNQSEVYREAQPARETAHRQELIEEAQKKGELYQSQALVRGYYTPEEAEFMGVSPDTLPWAGELARVRSMNEEEFSAYLKKTELDAETEKALVDYREASTMREDAYRASLKGTGSGSGSGSGKSTSTKKSEEDTPLSIKEAKSRLNAVMMGDAESGLPALCAVKYSIDRDYTMLLELGVRYGMTYAETKAFLDDTYDTVEAQILSDTGKKDQSWLLYGGTKWNGRG